VAPNRRDARRDEGRPAPPERLEVGRVGRAHGLHGEVSVTFVSNRSERTVPGAVLYGDGRELVVASARQHGGRWLVHFAGVEDRDAAERLRGALLTAEPLAPAEGVDELWVHELVGAPVVDRSGRPLGTIVALEANPAHDLLVLDGGALVPVVFVVDRRDGAVVVDVPDGLLDL
jgi:16S rRNA processing protein RimM